MGHHVIGLDSALAAGLGVADGEASVLCLVKEVLKIVAGLIGEQRGMIDGIEIAYGLDTHIHMVGEDCLETAELVAGREDEVTVVVIGDMVGPGHHRMGNRHGVVLARVLADNADELVVWVTNLIRLVFHIEAHLLIAVVILDIGARRHLGKDAHHALANRKTCLEQDIIGVVLLIYREQIVATNQELHVFIGQRELVVVIVDKGRPAGRIVINIDIIEATHIFTLEQLRRLPIGVAVGNTVAQIMDAVVQIIEVDHEVVIAAHHEYRRDVHIVGKAHLERPHVAVKDVDAGIHCVLGQRCESHETGTQQSDKRAFFHLVISI